MSAIAGGAAIGVGVGASSVALMPFNAANTFLGSAFFGYGMILGERYMYQEDWPKIQARLVNGEKIENIIQEYTGVFQAIVMKEAKIIFDSVTREMLEIMKNTLINVFPKPTEQPTGGPTIGDPRRPPSPSIPVPVPQPPPTDVGGVKLPPVQSPEPGMTKALWKFTFNQKQANVNVLVAKYYNALKLKAAGKNMNIPLFLANMTKAQKDLRDWLIKYPSSVWN